MSTGMEEEDEGMSKEQMDDFLRALGVTDTHGELELTISSWISCCHPNEDKMGMQTDTASRESGPTHIGYSSNLSMDHTVLLQRGQPPRTTLPVWCLLKPSKAGLKGSRQMPATDRRRPRGTPMGGRSP